MTCNDVWYALASLDHDRQLPDPMQTHLSTCRHCTRIAQAMKTAEMTVLPLATADEADNEMVEKIMDRIATVSSAYPPEAKTGTSLATWISGGLLLSAALVAVRFSAPFQYLAQSSLGHTVDLWVTLSMGTILAGYLCVFAGSYVFRPGASLRHDEHHARA